MTSSPALRPSIVMIDAPIGMKWSAGALFTDPRWVYGPPSGFADLAWVQHAIAHLPRHGGGRGFVVLADDACFRRGNDARIRAELVRSGSIEAILALPTSLTPGTSIRRSVWVVNRPEDSRDPSRILFADPGTGAGGAESGDELGALVDVYRRWRRGTFGRGSGRRVGAYRVRARGPRARGRSDTRRAGSLLALSTSPRPTSSSNCARSSAKRTPLSRRSRPCTGSTPASCSRASNAPSV